MAILSLLGAFHNAALAGRCSAAPPCPHCRPELHHYHVEALDRQLECRLSFMGDSPAAVVAWLSANGFTRQGDGKYFELPSRGLLARIRYGGDILDAAAVTALLIAATDAPTAA